MPSYDHFPVLNHLLYDLSGQPRYQYRIYNTGDQVWIMGNQVFCLVTHDGLCWSILDTRLKKLEGWNLFKHKVNMLWHRIKNL